MNYISNPFYQQQLEDNREMLLKNLISQNLESFINNIYHYQWQKNRNSNISYIIEQIEQLLRVQGITLPPPNNIRTIATNFEQDLTLKLREYNRKSYFEIKLHKFFWAFCAISTAIIALVSAFSLTKEFTISFASGLFVSLLQHDLNGAFTLIQNNKSIIFAAICIGLAVNYCQETINNYDFWKEKERAYNSNNFQNLIKPQEEWRVGLDQVTISTKVLRLFGEWPKGSPSYAAFELITDLCHQVSSVSSQISRA